MHPSSPEHISETEEFIDSSIEKNKNGKDLQLIIVDKETDEFLGVAGLYEINTSTPELGVRVKKSARGNGYGKRAMLVLKKRADKNLDYEYIIYPFDENNIASKKVAEFLGGEYVTEYDKYNMDGTLSHNLEYRIYPEK